MVIDRVDPAEPPEDKVRLLLLSEIAGGLLVTGEILSVKVTVPLKLFRLDTVMEELEVPPGWRVIEVGFAAIEKSGVVLTETRTLVEWDSDPLAPVTVTV